MKGDQYADLSVLIVDDNEDNLQIAAKVISTAGFRILLAQDGFEPSLSLKGGS